MTGITSATIELCTAEAFEQLIAIPENRERLLELVHGEVVEKMPTEEHGVIALKIGALLLAFVEQRQLGYVGVEIRHHKPSDRYNVRLPDVSFRQSGSPLVKQGAVPQMPDLAIEIQSPDDHPHDLREKAAYYLHHGSRLVWLVYPSKRMVEICHPDVNQEMIVIQTGIADMLDGGEVLPGFSLPAAHIFPG